MIRSIGYESTVVTLVNYVVTTNVEAMKSVSEESDEHEGKSDTFYVFREMEIILVVL